jgi:hypothetical protein
MRPAGETANSSPGAATSTKGLRPSDTLGDLRNVDEQDLNEEEAKRRDGVPAGMDGHDESEEAESGKEGNAGSGSDIPTGLEERSDPANLSHPMNLDEDDATSDDTVQNDTDTGGETEPVSPCKHGTDMA